MIDEFLLDKLKGIREENDIKQKDIAKELNVSQPNYARWESKAKIIPLEKLTWIILLVFLKLELKC